MLPYDPSRQDATRVQKLGMPNDPHVTIADQDDVSNLDETALRTLRQDGAKPADIRQMLGLH